MIGTRAASTRTRRRHIAMHPKHTPALRWLRQRWPDLFDPDRPRPLAVGIHHALLEALAAEQPPPCSRTALRRALYAWCRRPAYLVAVAAGGARHGLDGRPAETITPDQRQQARRALATLRQPRSPSRRPLLTLNNPHNGRKPPCS